jgi:hypothetical protein
MRRATLLTILLAGTALAAAGPRIGPKEAERHRAQLVTLVGVVDSVQSSDDGVVLRVGSVSVLVPQSVRGRFKPDPMELHQKAVEVTGFLTPPGRALAIVVQRPEDLRRDITPHRDEATILRERVSALEDEVARLRPLSFDEPPPRVQGGLTTGPRTETLLPVLGPYLTQTDVLAEFGLPTRVDYGNDRRTLYYGRQRWSFSASGHLIDIRTEE